MSDILNTEIQYLPGIGEKRAALLSEELGISTFRDMLYTFPFKYIDRTKIHSVCDIEPSMAYIQLRGRISSVRLIGEGRKKRLSAGFSDGTGSIELIWFQGIKWVQAKIAAGKEYIIFGRPSAYNRSWSLVHPELEEISEGRTISRSGLFMSIYSSTDKLRNGGISVRSFANLEQTLLSKVLPYISETLPHDIISRYSLSPLKWSLQAIHAPKNANDLNKARHRLKFEELFFLQLSLLKQKNVRMRGEKGLLCPRVGDAFNFCYKHLKFELTGAQKRVIKEIKSDMTSGQSMNRLLQGDVGSGKTLVALLTALLAVDNGFQACIMAPTEVLATQHYNNFINMMEGSNVKIALLTGNTKKRERDSIDTALEDGTLDILVGTHALIEERVSFSRLGFVVIDEQHRFGVEQRAKLRLKSETTPHVLVMTATPIPRTLAMTLYGDLDVSVLDELPPGRKPIQTLHLTENKRSGMYDFVKREIDKGHQAFIVYPLIRESEKMDYRNLEEGYMNIIDTFKAPEYVTAVVHGQQKAENKAYDMELFASGKAHILVATSVIEVGVDVPNASVMVIESAERFGLSQLHQLRGRVGRGAEKSYCILMTGYKLSKESRRRIELMCSTTDGFELAEEDMKMRGPGDMEGTRQSGLAIDLKIANLSTDGLLLNMAREAAASVLENDPLLSSEENFILASTLESLRRTGEIPVDYSVIS